MNLLRDDVELIEATLQSDTFQTHYPTLSKILSSAVETKKSHLTVLPDSVTSAKDAPMNIKEDVSDVEKSDAIQCSEENLDIDHQHTVPTGFLQSPEEKILSSTKNGPTSPNLFSNPVSENETPVGEVIQSPKNERRLIEQKKYQPPEYYMRRLLEIRNAYSHILQHRNTVKYFYETLRRTPSVGRRIPHKISTSASNDVGKSRLARYASIYRPTASLGEIDHQPLELRGLNSINNPYGGLDQSFNGFNGDPNGINFEPFLKDNPEEYDTIVKGVQKLPKPNPAWLFHKNACDVSLSHLTDFAKRLRDEIQDIERRWTEAQFRQEIEEFTHIGVDERLASLYETQQMFSLEQQKERDEIRQSAALCNSELNSFLHRTRENYYTQLYSSRENPAFVDEAKKRTIYTTQRASEVLDLEESLLWKSSNNDIKKKLNDCGFYRVCHKKVSSPDPVEKIRILNEWGFSETPVVVQDRDRLKTCFPGIFPKVKYEWKGRYPRSSSLPVPKKKQLTVCPPQRLLDPSSENLSEAVTKLIYSPELERSKALMSRQRKEREFEDDWERFQKTEMAERQTALQSVINVPHAPPLPKISIASKEVEKKKTISIDPMVAAKKKVLHQKTLNNSTPKSQVNAFSNTNDERRLSLQEKSNGMLKISAPIMKTDSQCRASSLSNSKLISQLPRHRCPVYVEINQEDKSIEPLDVLYGKILRAIQQDRLGLSSMAETVYHFTKKCAELSFDLEQAEIKDYADIILKGLLHYPLQLELLYVGVTALFILYNASSNKAEFVPLYFSGLTTLLAVNERPLQLQLIEGLSTLMDSSQSVNLNTDLVDFLLEILVQFDNVELTEHGLKILCLGCVGHRKKEQYSLFIQCLSKWKTEWRVLVHCCLAIDAFGQRARLELYRTHHRRRSSLGSEKTKDTLAQNQVETLPSNPTNWMSADGSDVDHVVEVMKLHINNRKLVGAACASLVTLASVSRVHVATLSKHDWTLFLHVSEIHPSSQSIALAVAHMTKTLAVFSPDASSMINSSTVGCLVRILNQHTTSLPVLTECYRSLCFLVDKKIELSKCFTDCPWPSLLTVAKDNVKDKDLSLSFSTFLEFCCRISERKFIQKLDTVNVYSYLCELANCYGGDEMIIMNVGHIMDTFIIKCPWIKNYLDQINMIDPLITSLVALQTNLDVVRLLIKLLKCFARINIRSLKWLKEDHVYQLGVVWQATNKTKHFEICREISEYFDSLKNKSEQLEFQLSSPTCMETFRRCQ